MRGVERVFLKTGESKRVEFDVVPDRDLRYYDDVLKQYVVDAGVYQIQIGSSSEDIRGKAALRVR